MTVIEHEARTDDELVLGSDEPDPSSIRRVRHRIVQWLGEHDVAEDTRVAVELAASELVTNAIRHADSGYAIRLRQRATAIELRVFDEDPRLPVAVEAADDALCGRGLQIVSMVAGAWGAHPDAWRGASGKTVWARFDLTS